MKGWKFTKGSKYHSRKMVVDGITFDSTKEGQRYMHLRLLQKAGEISDLQIQVPYLLLPSQKAFLGKVKIRTERPVKYIADFVYRDREGNLVVEDTKGLRTTDYVIKRKLMLYIHKIVVTEV